MYCHLHDFNKIKSTAGDLFAPGWYDIKDKVCHIFFFSNIILQAYVSTVQAVVQHLFERHSASTCGGHTLGEGGSDPIPDTRYEERR
jgi:hypothetical protein